LEKKTQTFKYIKAVAEVFFVFAVLIYFLSGFYLIAPQQRGVLTRFGRLVDERIMPGIHYHLPWPMEKVQIIKVTEYRRLSMTFQEYDRDYTQPGSLLTSDENIVQITLLVQYNIKKPGQFLFSAPKPERLLDYIVRYAAIVVSAGLPIDQIMTTGRQLLKVEVKNLAQKLADSYKLGISIAAIHIKSITPPAKVKNSFADVASAREDKIKLIQKAKGESNRKLPEARGKVEEILNEAHSYKTELIEAAHGESKAFLALLKEYNHSKQITTRKLYLEALNRILSKTKKYIYDPQAEQFLKANRPNPEWLNPRP